jgi:glycosyltransferase involved in cell wall biosynthesis
LKADNLGEWSGRFHDPGLARFGMKHNRLPFSVIVALRNKLLKRARNFICISSAVKEELLAGGIPETQIESIPNSVDVTRFRPIEPRKKRSLRIALGLPDTWPVAVYTGRIETSKGIPLLVSEWKNIIEKYPNATLVLVGGGGPHLHNCEPEMRRFVSEQGLQQQILFTGSVTNVWEYLQASDVFVFPSEREAFGISVAEAMACALPVVTTDIDGLSDVIVPKITAEVFPASSRTGLRNAIMRVLDNTEYAKKLGESGRERAVALFSETEVVAKYLDVVRHASHEKLLSE